MTDRNYLDTLQRLWRREAEGAVTYRELATREADQRRRQILLRLAEAEDRHAEKWADRIRAVGGTVPAPSAVSSSLNWLQRFSDPAILLNRLEREEEADVTQYARLARELPDARAREYANEVFRDSRDHAHILRALAGPLPGARSVLDTILRRERHVSGGGWIGSAVYGANDGLGAVFGIVSGMSGYTGGSEVVLAAGLAGMLASSLSMGAGAYLATKSEREMNEAEVAREQQEIAESPEEEQMELELFYELKGFSHDEAAAMVHKLQGQPKQFLNALLHEELGLSETRFPNPLQATISAALSTAAGGFIPIIPFFVTTGMPAVIASLIVSLLAHFAIGAAKYLVTTRSWWASGLEMTVVGALEAAVTYGVGVLFAR